MLQGNLDVLSDTLDVTSDLLARFGNVMSGYHSHLKAAILPHLEEPRPVVRKRAIQSMGKHTASKHLVKYNLVNVFSNNQVLVHCYLLVFGTDNTTVEVCQAVSNVIMFRL